MTPPPTASRYFTLLPILHTAEIVPDFPCPLGLVLTWPYTRFITVL